MLSNHQIALLFLRVGVANGYYRDIRSSTVNGDLNEGSLDQPVYQPSPADQRALAAAGYTGFPTSGANASNTPFPYWRCIAQALQRGRADPGIPEAGRQLRPHQAGRGMLTSDQRTSTLDGGPVQIIDNQRQDDPR
jgi:hypothetical protein